MYRLLIVDDEEIITESLYEVFSQLKSEELDIYKAFSAKEALSWLSRTRIDIVLTDIRMPGMSGLELSKEILNYWPRCKIIFLTGYSEFEYAYEAFQMKNVKYLLKTEGYAKVTETVLSVVEEIKTDNRINNIIEKSQKQLELYEQMEQGEYLRYFVQDSQIFHDRETELSENFQRLNINLNANAPVFLVLGRVVHPSEITYTEQAKLLTSVRVIWEQFISNQLHHLAIVDRKGDWLWFLQPSDYNDEKFNEHLIRYLEGTLEQIQEACQQSLGIELSFTISGSKSNWSKVTLQYERLRELQQMKIGDGLSSIQIDLYSQTTDVENKESTRLASKVEILNGHLEIGRKDEFIDSFTEMKEYALHHVCSFQKVNEIYYSLSLMLLTYINRKGLHGQLNNLEKLMRLEAHKTIEDGFHYLLEIGKRVLDIKSMDERDRASTVAEKICEFIQDHLHEDLSLVRLAEVHHFNPSYLSRFFKQEKGMNISEYIDNCRITKAKELLSNGDLKVREVALKVGYEAAHSFTRFFKKSTGMTPQEYKDSLIYN
ncbi:response regulator transcription factor [Lederbergia graminis]|uniref:Helix-turn-helix domain-containing protein n=1 Tax=Lederbergia graminis TaxID=735518 RepID=A0ABW0LIW7_9BACI